jgi:hypothetical protein
MVTTPDYTAQLNEIVRALNRPVTPTWLVSLLSVFAGAVFTLIVQSLLLRINDWHKREKMRKIVYMELGRLYASVKFILTWNPKNAPPGTLPASKAAHLRQHLSFAGEKYIHDNQDVFVQLDEHSAIRTMYSLFHQVSETDETHLDLNCTTALTMFSTLVHQEMFGGRCIKKYMHPSVQKDLYADQITLESHAWTPAGRGEPEDTGFGHGPVK